MNLGIVYLLKQQKTTKMVQKISNAATLLFMIAAFLFGCNQPDPKNQPLQAAGISPDSVLALVQQAYLYGYPIMMMDATKKVSTNVAAPIPGKPIAPINQFGHFRTFPDANFKDVVKPNCDTYYSLAWLDLASEPLVLSVPNTNGRYYLLPMLDAYTNVFASPGKRTTGTEEGNFFITGPAFTGSIPAGMRPIKAPTNMVWILGRTQTNSKQDGATVVKIIQDAYKLTPLSKWGTPYKPEMQKTDTSVPKMPPPVWVENMAIETYFNKLNQLMQENPPPAMDSAFLEKIVPLGLGAGKQFDLSAFDAATQEKLKAIPAAVHAGLREATGKMGTLENGWNVTRTGMGTYGTNYVQRAVVALIGLGANLNEDACYPNCQVDETGQKLNGAKKYIMHFEKGQTPPVNAFWSITMYGSDELLVANPINRFAIGDRDHLKYNDDGSLDIFIQHERPGKDKEANWLPAAKEDFSITMRLYWPKETFMNGSWKIPPVKVVP
jgi:DNA sulfur modification protein DndE